MADGLDILERITALGVQTWAGTAYRHTTANRTPLSGEGSRAFGGRWNPPESFPTIYTTTSIESCIAEFRRMAEGQAEGPRSFKSRVIHTLEVVDLRVLDISSSEALESLGLSIDDITDPDWSRCQEIGEVTHYLGFEGLVAPSATQEGLVLAVFEDMARPEAVKLVRTDPMPPVI